MKLLFTSLLLILSFLNTVQQSEIFTCTVVEPDKVIACPSGGNTQNKPTLWQIENWHQDLIDEWRLTAEYVDSPVGGKILSVSAPLKKEPLKASQKVKATLGEDGKLTPIASCEVRVYRNVRVFLDHGDRPPMSAWQLPEDCKQ